MDSKTLIKALKVAVREVIKEELTEILREGLQSTITEIKHTQPKQRAIQKSAPSVTKKNKPMFEENRWAAVLNDTDPLVENGPLVMNSFKDMMQEGMDEIRMTSKDAAGFGNMRQNMKSALGLAPEAPQVMEDPETGKVYDVAPEVQQAMTRDYSALMKAMNKKKGH
jgi:hypothetical protein